MEFERAQDAVSGVGIHIASTHKKSDLDSEIEAANVRRAKGDRPKAINRSPGYEQDDKGRHVNRLNGSLNERRDNSIK